MEESIQPIAVAVTVISIILMIQVRNIWLAKYRTEQRTSQFNRIVDAAGSGSDLMQFLRSDEGRQVLRILAMPADVKAGGSGVVYVWAALFTAVGLGLFILGFSANDTFVPGTLSLCLGLGLFAGETVRRRADRQRQDVYMREAEVWHLGPSS